MKSNILKNAGWILFALWFCAAATPEARAEKNEVKGGARLWSESCSQCHNSRSPATLSDKQWETAMLHMRVRGNLTAEEHKAILDFLKSAN